MSRPAIRACKRNCGYPAAKGRQFCYWHALMRSSSDAQAEAAIARRERQLGQDLVDYVARMPKAKWPPGERWCAGCQSFVPKFYCSGSRCKACASAASHARRLEDNYGIDAAQYRRIFASQGGRCAICRNQPRTIRFAVDHDHKTGEVRGILCKRCNHDLLGGGHDSVETIWNALAYLLFPPAQRLGAAGPSRAEVIEALGERLDLVERLRAPSVDEDDPPPF